ncbi:hypothetical protein C9374_006397 [Naegleria lovaniensis]|uniref:Xrn1 N-terminal domain-containing protein n=1 Tax=Naegleria lovaniensis TaxID=51637 RepID=A0AA88KJ45_NAELO|nr:uncharacterized protein C9374_006397 [Naegleria lovaniensis]KAG2381408.1 hypothetical protein C9374_006397 [Naegleria lovaniensis]
MGVNRTTILSILSFILGTTNGTSMNQIVSACQNNSSHSITPSIVYIDGNSLIHHKLQTAIPESATTNTLFNESNMKKIVEQVKDSLCTQIEQIYLSHRPIEKIVLVFDGPCPFAKNNEQRKRRFSNVSSLIASPGTFFMFKLCQAMYKWSADTFYAHSRKGIDITVEFSDCFVEGEGEIKILESIRKYHACHSDEKLSAKTRHIVHTKDSDFTLLLLACLEENIILVNDYQKIEKNVLVRKLKDQFGIVGEDQNSHTTIHRIMLDLVLLCITFGNDYLQPMPHEQKLLNLLLRYKKKKLKEKYSQRFLVEVNSDHVKMDMDFFIRILLKSKDVQPNMTRSEKEIDETRKYLESLMWCISTYETGVCKDYRHFSNHNPPILLGQMIQDMRKLIERNGNSLKYTSLGQTSLKPATFLMSVMPFTVFRQSIPKPILAVIEKDKSIIREYQNHFLKAEHFDQLKKLEELLLNEVNLKSCPEADNEIWMEKLLTKSQSFSISKKHVESTYLRINRVWNAMKKSSMGL